MHTSDCTDRSVSAMRLDGPAASRHPRTSWGGATDAGSASAFYAARKCRLAFHADCVKACYRRCAEWKPRACCNIARKLWSCIMNRGADISLPIARRPPRATSYRRTVTARDFCHPAPCQAIAAPGRFRFYQEPVLGMLVQGSDGDSAPPACSSSREIPSGVRMKAMRPSRGGRLIVTPRAMKALQVS